MSKSFEQFVEYLEKIITKEEPLRQPPIVIVHCPVKLIKDIYISLVAKLKELKVKHGQWNYYLINMEKKMFDILAELDYIGGDNLALTCSREDLKKDLSASVLKEMVSSVESEIDRIIAANTSSQHPPFVILMNIHGCYDYIQTKDIISRIINKERILILVLYLELGLSEINPEEDESYKLANYNVHPVHISSLK
ncbi:MAG: hypothetical protein ACFFD4_23070 [Candidatus Odinarchaeota archaeon]